MIEVSGLTKHYGPITAIRDVSFTVGRGQIVGFLGPNGAGKSTTMRILACFMPASGGIRSRARSIVGEPSGLRGRGLKPTTPISPEEACRE